MNYLLQRINPDLNQARYYRIHIGPYIAGDHAVYRVWGRIGRRRSGSLILPCATPEQAEALAVKLVAAKLKRGYVVVE